MPKEANLSEDILRLLLDEILKDGKVEPFEKKAIEKVFPLLKIPVDRFNVIYREIQKKFEGNLQAGGFDFPNFSISLKALLNKRLPPQQAQKNCEIICSIIKSAFPKETPGSGGQKKEDAIVPPKKVQRYKPLKEGEIKTNFSENREKALLLCDEILEVDPDNDGVHCNKGILLYNLKEYYKAAESLLRSLELNPTDVACFYLGLTYGFLKQEGKALEYLEQAEKLFDPGGRLNLHEEIYMEKGMLLCEIGRFDEAEPLLQKCYDVLASNGAPPEVLRLSKPKHWLNKCIEGKNKPKVCNSSAAINVMAGDGKTEPKDKAHTESGKKTAAKSDERFGELNTGSLVPPKKSSATSKISSPEPDSGGSRFTLLAIILVVGIIGVCLVFFLFRGSIF